MPISDAARQNLKHVGAASAGVIALAAILIQHWEGTELVAKHNSFDPAGVITVCSGTTQDDIPGLKSGQRFTPEFCAAQLRKDIPRYNEMLRTCVYADMPPHRYAAFLSFFYNLGPRTACRSTAVRELNAGNIKAACEGMTLYNKAAGQYLPGLKNRREDQFWGERAWCLRTD